MDFMTQILPTTALENPRSVSVGSQAGSITREMWTNERAAHVHCHPERGRTKEQLRYVVILSVEEQKSSSRALSSWARIGLCAKAQRPTAVEGSLPWASRREIPTLRTLLNRRGNFRRTF